MKVGLEYETVRHVDYGSLIYVAMQFTRDKNEAGRFTLFLLPFNPIVRTVIFLRWYHIGTNNNVSASLFDWFQQCFWFQVQLCLHTFYSGVDSVDSFTAVWKRNSIEEHNLVV